MSNRTVMKNMIRYDSPCGVKCLTYLRHV